MKASFLPLSAWVGLWLMGTAMAGGLPPWLNKVAVKPLPVTLTAKQVKTSPYLIEPITDTVTLNIAKEAIHWRSDLDPKGFVIGANGIGKGKGKDSGPSPSWLGRLFTAMQAVAAGNFAALAQDFELNSPGKGQLVATPKAKDMAAAIKELNLVFTTADSGPYELDKLTITAAHEQTVLSELRYQGSAKPIPSSAPKSQKP